MTRRDRRLSPRLRSGSASPASRWASSSRPRAVAARAASWCPLSASRLCPRSASTAVASRRGAQRGTARVAAGDLGRQRHVHRARPVERLPPCRERAAGAGGERRCRARVAGEQREPRRVEPCRVTESTAPAAAEASTKRPRSSRASASSRSATYASARERKSQHAAQSESSPTSMRSSRARQSIGSPSSSRSRASLISASATAALGPELGVDRARRFEIPPRTRHFAEVGEEEAAVVEQPRLPDPVARTAQRAERRVGSADAGRALAGGAGHGDLEDLGARAVEPRQRREGRLDLAAGRGGLPGVGEIDGEVAARERGPSMVAAADAEPDRVAHGLQRTGVAERVAREPERVQRGHLRLAVVVLARKLERLSGRRKRLTRIRPGRVRAPARRARAARPPVPCWTFLGACIRLAAPCSSVLARPRPQREEDDDDESSDACRVPAAGARRRARRRRSSPAGSRRRRSAGARASPCRRTGTSPRRCSPASSRAASRRSRARRTCSSRARRSASAVVDGDRRAARRRAGRGRDPGVTRAARLARRVRHRQRRSSAGLRRAPREDVHIWRLKHTRGVQAASRRRRGRLGRSPACSRRTEIRSRAGRAEPRADPGPNWHTARGARPSRPAARTLPAAAAPGRRRRRDRLGLHRGRADRARGSSSPVDHGEWFSEAGRPAGTRAAVRVEAPSCPSRSTRAGTAARHARRPRRLRRRRVAQRVPAGEDHGGEPQRRLRRQDDADTPIPTEASVARSLWRHRSPT